MIGKFITCFVLCWLCIANAQGQLLDSLLKMVVENSPELKALQLEYEAELMKVDQVRTIPNTQFGIGIPALRPETRLGPQLIMVSASQMFPWFGARKVKGDVVVSMSKAKYERISVIRLELFNKVELAYYALVDLKQKAGIINEILKQFEVLKQLALTKMEGGSGRMTNVLRVELKQDELKQQLKRIEASKQKYFAIINSLTLAPWATTIDVDDVGVELFEFNLKESRKKISEHYPLITMIDRQIAASRNKQLVNRKMGAPMIGVGLDYSIVGERTDMIPEYNGRDILIPKLMISIPLYRKGFKAKNIEEGLIQSALEFNQESIEQRVIGQLLHYHTDYKLALLEIELNEEQIGTTKKIMDLLLTEYSTEGGSFDELLQVQNQLLGYELELSTAKKMVNMAVSNMERLINY